MGLGSGIRKKPFPDYGSRIQGSKMHRIQDPDSQHWPPGSDLYNLGSGSARTIYGPGTLCDSKIKGAQLLTIMGVRMHFSAR